MTSHAKDYGMTMITKVKRNISGDDALMGDTRSHPEHDG